MGLRLVVLVGIQNVGVAGGKRIPGTHQRALPDGLHGRRGGFHVAGVRVSCRVVSIAVCVLLCDTGE